MIGADNQALNVVLEVQLDDDLELDDYVVNFLRMIGNTNHTSY
ncbi:MAG: hypothetical protein IV101_06005 [Dechloromonas sp.]|nr:hypothetical protein [Dechloromonas sp.]MBT9520431.1 hypothetical protein [Dechloromonas sp.]